MSANLTDRGRRKGSLSDRAVATAQGVLRGERGGWRRYLVFAGPAIIASIAYVDPGNFATNIQAGAKFGYGLLWVVLLANVIAMLFQALSAKLGIVTAQPCRNVPGAICQAGSSGDVGGQRNSGHGHRSRGVSRRRDRSVDIIPSAAVRRHGGDRHRDLRAAAVPELRLSPDRTYHRQHGEHYRALLSGRDLCRTDRLG